MSNEIYEEETIHLSEIDDYLASKLVGSRAKTHMFRVCGLDPQGYITIGQGEARVGIDEGGIDFELSPSSYPSLESIEIGDFTTQTIYTSSAYEFFDFILMYLSQLECVVDFTNSSWRIRILSYDQAGQ